MNKLFLLVLLYLNCFFSYAQSAEKIDTENDTRLRAAIFGEADFVFEGTILETKKYLNPENKFLASLLVQVHKVFKGDLQPGTIEIVSITVGEYTDPVTGEINDVSLPSHTEVGGRFVEGATSLFTAVSGEKLPNLKLQSKFSPTNPSPVFLTANIYYDLSHEYRDVFTSLSGGQILKGKGFKTAQDLYDFILQTPNTSLVDFDNIKFEKQLPPVIIPSPDQSPPADTAALRRNYERHMEIYKLKREHYEKTKKGPSAFMN